MPRPVKKRKLVGGRKPSSRTPLLRSLPAKKPKAYSPPTKMLSLLKKTLSDWSSLKFSDFKSFSLLSENQTIFLWGRQHPLRKEFIFGKGLAHPLVSLLVANKIVVERNKTLKQIAIEASEILSKRFHRPFKLSENFVNLVNKIFRLRSREELQRKGKWGGAREELSDAMRASIINDLKTSRLSIKKIAEKCGVSWFSVYSLGVNEEIIKPKLNEKRGVRVPLEKEALIRKLIEQGELNDKQIAEQAGVSHYTVYIKRTGKNYYKRASSA
ncbi:MAG: hypothetical protein ABH986_00580 [archaeon]